MRAESSYERLILEAPWLEDCDLVRIIAKYPDSGVGFFY